MFQLQKTSAFVVGSTLLAAAANAQIGATLRYEVALPGGTWGSSVTINPGDRVEWRAVVNFTGTQAAAALARIRYQPVLSNADNEGAMDQVGDFRILPNPLLDVSEGQSTQSLATYGRVTYAMSLAPTYLAHRHSGGTNGAPAGDYIRIALTSGTQWYPPSGGGTTLNSVVSDNQNTALLTGTQNLTIFRQAFIASSDVPATVRTLSLYSEAGATGNVDEPLMTWALPGESTTTATVRTAVAFIPATINIVPAPSVLTLSTLSVFAASRRRR